MQRSCTAIVSSLRTEKYLESRSEKWSVPADIVLGVGHNLRLKLLMVSSVLTLRTTLWSRRCNLIFGGRVAKLQIVNDTEYRHIFYSRYITFTIESTSETQKQFRWYYNNIKWILGNHSTSNHCGKIKVIALFIKFTN